MSRRLPVLGGTAADGAAARPLALAAERPRVPRPTVAVVAASPVVGGAGELACALVAGLAAAGHAVGALVCREGGAGGGSSPSERLRLAGAAEVRALSPAAPAPAAALAAAYEELSGASVIVAWGALLPLWRTPTLTVLVTGGLLPSAYGPEARALRGVCDVLLPEPREGFARALASAFPGTPLPPPGGTDSATCAEPPLR